MPAHKCHVGHAGSKASGGTGNGGMRGIKNKSNLNKSKAIICITMQREVQWENKATDLCTVLQLAPNNHT